MLYCVSIPKSYTTIWNVIYQGEVVFWKIDMNWLKKKTKLKFSFVNIMHLQKSPGVTPRSKDQRRELRDFQIRQYFEGPTLDLYPHSFDVKFTDIEIYKVMFFSVEMK